MGKCVTEHTIERWVLDGRGQGHHHDYEAWIQIARRGSPSGGNLQDRYIPQFDRFFDLMSANELQVGRFILWLGVDDLREGFPCWTVPHPHPLYLHPEFCASPIPWSHGTIRCAEALGIKHPTFVGTKIPYVLTLDFLATLRTPTGVRAVAIPVKPDEADVPLKESDLLKLAITKEYCSKLNIPWRLASGSMIPPTLNSNLEICIHYSGLLSTAEQSISETFFDELNQRLGPDHPIHETLTTIEQSMCLDQATVTRLFYRALWFRKSQIDLRQALVLSEPPAFSSTTWVDATYKYLLGE